MKKTSIKVFGVCAATLLTLGAVAPVAVHAEEVTATNEVTTLQDQINSQDNLKREADLSVQEAKELLTFLKENKALFDTTDITLDNTDVQNAGDVAIKQVADGKDAEALKPLFHNLSTPVVKWNLGLEQSYAAKDDTEIIMATSAAPNTYYNEGDSFSVSFWAKGYQTGNPEKYTKVGETKITISNFLEVADYSVQSSNINAQVGDLYNPAQNITVTNKKDGYNIKNPVVVFIDGTNVKYFGRDNVIKSLTDATVGTNGRVEYTNDAITEVQNEFNYNIGDFYFLVDRSNFATPVRVKTEEISLGFGQKQTFEYYNADVKDFYQQLQINIPKETEPGQYDTVELYTNRMINVTGETEGETPVETKVPVYRAYNPNNGDHLFTTSLKEYNEVVDKGWAPEGLAWNAATEEDGTKPVYRLYNPNSGEHFYTDSEKEYNEVAAAGWNKEGIAFYSAASEDGVKIFRSFNPNATGPGSHMFTDSEKEYNELTAAGWSPEGVAFYGMN